MQAQGQAGRMAAWGAVAWSVVAAVVFHYARPFLVYGPWPWVLTPRWLADMQGASAGVPAELVRQAVLFVALFGLLLVVGGDAFAFLYRGAGRFEALVWGGGFAVAALGTLTFAMGAAGLIGPAAPGFSVVLGGLMGYVLWRVVSWRRTGAWGAARERVLGAWRGVSWPERAALALAVGLGLVAWLYALTPSVQSDALRYHLAGPQEWLKAGRLAYLPYNAFTSFPSNIDMLFLFALGLGGDLLAKCMHFAFLPLCVGAIVAIVREAGADTRILGMRASLWAALAWAISPLALPLAGWAFIDLGVLYFTLGAAYFSMRWVRGGRRRDLVAGALMAGCVCAAKYTGVLVAWWGGVVVLGFAVWRGPGGVGRCLRRGMGLALGYGLLAALVVAPWWVRNAVQTGNPVYPLATGVFGGGEWTEVNQEFLESKAGEKGGRGLGWALALPWTTAAQPRRFGGFSLGPLYWVMLPWWVGWCLAALGRARQRPVPAVLALWLGFALVAWYLTYQSNRFLLPAAALGAVAAARGLAGARRWSGRAAAAGAVCLVLTVMANGLDAGRWLLFDAGRIVESRARPLSRVRWPAYTTGHVGREAFLAWHLNYYDCASYCNRSLGPGDRVLLVGEHRKMHWLCRVEGADWFDTPRIRPYLRRASDASALVDLLRAEGYTHLFFNLDEMGWPDPQRGGAGPAWAYNRRFLSDRDILILQGLIRSPRLREIYSTRPGRIYVARLLP